MMKKKLKILPVALLALAGCQNAAIVLDDSARGLEQAHAGGQFVVEAVSVDTPNLSNGRVELNRSGRHANAGRSSSAGEAGLLMEWLVSGSSDAEVFRPAEDRRRKSVGSKVKVSGRKADSAGGLASMNNFLSGLTLTIWPWYSSDTYTYDVTVSLAGKQRRHASYSFERRSLFSILPLGKIPVPALADVRGGEADHLGHLERKIMRQAVTSLFTEEAYEQAVREAAAGAASDTKKDGGAK